MNFNDVAPPPENTDFANAAGAYFDDETARKVLDLFGQLGLPAPRGKKEFLAGTDGLLVFLNKYGVVIRVESADTYRKRPEKRVVASYDRIDDTPWVLRPLASFTLGQAVVEICPGTKTVGYNDAGEEELMRRLRQDGVYFWDSQTANIGRVPIRTPSFPDGVRVVIDRGAVRRLTNGAAVVKEALAQAESAEVEGALRDLYGPLRDAFLKAWDGAPRDMRPFWKMCRKYVRKGKLVAGWKKHADSWTKQERAAQTARAYNRSRLSWGRGLFHG